MPVGCLDKFFPGGSVEFWIKAPHVGRFGIGQRANPIVSLGWMALLGSGVRLSRSC
jgi:hypothetical protein